MKPSPKPKNIPSGCYGFCAARLELALYRIKLPSYLLELSSYRIKLAFVSVRTAVV